MLMVFAIGLSIAGYIAYALLQENAKREVVEQASLMMDGALAVRNYTIKEIKPLIEVVMLTGNATVESAVEGMKLGAQDYLMKPCETEDLVSKIDKAWQRKAELEERIRAAKVADVLASPMPVLKD